jgi:hypothetical protein
MEFEALIRKNCHHMFTRFGLPKEHLLIDGVQKRFIKTICHFTSLGQNDSHEALDKVLGFPRSLQLSDAELTELQAVLKAHGFPITLLTSSSKQILQWEMERLIRVLRSESPRLQANVLPILLKAISDLAVEMGIVLSSASDTGSKKSAFTSMSFDNTTEDALTLHVKSTSVSRRKKPSADPVEIPSAAAVDVFPFVSIDPREISSMINGLRSLAFSHQNRF